jgi:hypothetical protein
MIVYNQALILVPTLYFSLFANARKRVSWNRSFAASESRVRVMANGFRNSALFTSMLLNSMVDIVNVFKCVSKIKQ